MPAFLKTDPDADILTIELSGMRGPEFSDALTRVKSIPGRRFNPDTKKWELPREADTALRAVQMLQPVTDAETQVLIRQASEDVAEALVTKLPDDADLQWDNASQMRPYQRAAVEFFMEHPHSILADEMGTGKTLQALATIEEAEERARNGQASPFDPSAPRPGPVLIVCPNSLTGTWKDEIAKWVGGDCQVIDGKNPAARKKQVEEDHDYYVVNWEKLRLMPELAKRKWGAVIADEAHRAKNRKAKQTQALWKLKAPIQLAMTGTPVMNSAGELWPLLRWLRPEQYTGYWPFHYSYVDEYPAFKGTVVVGVKNADQLRFELADKMVRRTKQDVLKDLPPKTIQVIPVELDGPTRKLYSEVEEALILDIAKFVADEKNEVTLEDIEDMPLDRLFGLIEHAAARLTKLRQITSAYKVGVADEIIRDHLGKPFVAFTWYKDSAQSLVDKLTKGKPPIRTGRIAGNDNPDPIKDAFQEGDLDVVVATIAKGGTGLTLTRADTAIFVDEDWVPANNVQAEDRLHRIGQTNPVTILRLRCSDTIDVSKVAPANRVKELIAAQVLGTPEEDE